MTRLIPYIVLALFITSCAGPSIQKINSEVDNDRTIASTESCTSIATKIINQNHEVIAPKAKVLDKAIVDNSLIEPSFTKMLLKRSDLKTKYESVVESIRDFNPAADLAIKGTANIYWMQCACNLI